MGVLLPAIWQLWHFQENKSYAKGAAKLLTKYKIGSVESRERARRGIYRTSEKHAARLVVLSI